MRRRLLIVSLTFVGVLLAALMVPLVAAYASDRTQDFFVERLSDTTRFAVLAEDSLETDDVSGLLSDLERYTEVYGGSVVVVNANSEIVAESGAGTTDPRTEEATVRALHGASAEPPATAWPWGDPSVVIASPVGRDSQVLGAVVMTAPTSSLHDEIELGIALLTVLGLGALLLTAYGVVVPFVGWVLRPVRDLDLTAKTLASGDLSSRATETGPPELRDLARSFNGMADNVESSQRQQRELVADAAHQLGNPLTALRLRAENLASTVSEPAAVEPVLEEADRLSATVESLLRLSQVGAAPVRAEPVDLVPLVRHRCDMWSPVFASLEVVTPEQATAMATADVIDLSLDALLDNAAKFAPGSPVRVTVSAVADEDRDELCIEVRDEGPGLHPEDAAKVGARFFRGRAHQNVAGTGLGLSIVQARLADLDGRLVVTTPPEGGLSVALRLPAAAQIRPSR